MAKFVLANKSITGMNLSEEDLRVFVQKYQSFMEDFVSNPTLIGVSKISYNLEIVANGYELVAETNKAMGNNSKIHLRTVTTGFIGGYCAK